MTPPAGHPETESFATRLLAWWEQHGRHELPWQHPRTPYRVWISEIMLQQTQVATVVPYFERWMERFADLPALAAAPADDVLAQWAGLGYYTRARNLHRAAQVCVECHGGRLPLQTAALCALPGIGESTANAIISQSTDQPAAVLDGNVRRVLARHAAIAGWTGAPATQSALWAEARARLPSARGADYTQAIMDLGALICIRRRPHCPSCPVRGDCAALAADAVAAYPAPRPRTRVAERTFVALLLRDAAGRVLLERRPPAGIWGGLWSLPEAPDAVELSNALGIDLGGAVALPELEHRLTHRLLRIRPLLLDRVEAAGVRQTGEQGWFLPGGAGFPGVPRPVAALLAALESAPPGS